MKSVTPELMVPDVAKAVEFYREILHFQVAATVPKQPPYDWALMKNGGVELMLESQAALAEELPVL